MIPTVRDDKLVPLVSRRGTAVTARPSRSLGLLLAGVLIAPAALAQQPAATGEFTASVRAVDEQIRRLPVPLNRSMMVETTVEVSRVDVIAPHIADVQLISPMQILVTGRSYGVTNIVLWGPNNEQYVLEASVELDLSALNEALKQIDPQSTVEARSVLGNVVLTGTVSNAVMAQRMMDVANLFIPALSDGTRATSIQNHLDVAGEQQVMLKCVVAEVSRSAVRQLGVNGFLAGDDFRDAFLINQLGGINPINIGAAADALVNDTIPFLTGEEGIPLTTTPTLSLGFPRVQMQVFIRAMNDNGLLRVLAEPNLVATSGETATFLAGGEFPIPVPQGDFRVTIEFRQFGVRLNFTPVVLGEDRIRLRVAPEVSELDFSSAVQVQGFTIPGLTSRSAETTVEVGSGQTLAMAGLLNEQVRALSSRVPGIGEVPILGALFRSVEFRRSLTELVILVTPEIVTPLDPHQVAAAHLPGSEITDPSDWQLYANGWLESRDDGSAANGGAEGYTSTHTAEQVPTQRTELSLHGPWGYAAADDSR